MDWFLLALSTLFMATGALIGGAFNRTGAKGNTQPLYATVLIIFATICWGILFIFQPEVHAGVIIYSILFGICYASSNICLIMALKHGPISLSNLFLQFSLIVTSIWGLLFWNSELKPTVFIGLAVAAVSLVLCLYRKESSKINLKWLIWAILLLVSNAGCAIIQKSQQLAFDFKYGTSFMFFATVISSIASIAWFALAKKPENTSTVIKKYGFLPCIAGIINFLLNLLVIMLASGTLSPSLIYPVIAIGGIAINSVASVIFFKERLAAVQWIGIALGAVAVALLSL